MKYRSRSEIIANLLRAANEGATKTRLMYAAYLSYPQIKEYISFLEDKGLVMKEGERSVYRLTEKGLRYLRVLGEMNDLVTAGGEDDVGTTDPAGSSGALGALATA